MLVDGAGLLSTCLRQLAPYAPCFSSRRVFIIIAGGSTDSPTTLISARQKYRAFSQLGFDAKIVRWGDLEKVNLSSFASQVFYVAQKPIEGSELGLPRAAINLDLESPIPEYDGFAAVVETVGRIVEPYLSADAKVVVLGGRGWVGGQLVEIFRQRGASPVVVDVGDDPEVANAATIVVSAVGKPGLVGPHLLSSARLVVDVGFVFDDTTQEVRGDVSREAYALPLMITPVPGGVGPLQVLTLVERAAARIPGVQYRPWHVLHSGT